MKGRSGIKYPRSFNSVWGLILGLLTAFVLYNVFDYMFSKKTREGMEHATDEPKRKRNPMEEDTELVNPLEDALMTPN
jgi:hypothetical protein